MEYKLGTDVYCNSCVMPTLPTKRNAIKIIEVAALSGPVTGSPASVWKLKTVDSTGIHASGHLDSDTREA
jgi:hypothetical protein